MEVTLDELLYAQASHYQQELIRKLDNDPRKALIELTQAHREKLQREATAHLPEEAVK